MKIALSTILIFVLCIPIYALDQTQDSKEAEVKKQAKEYFGMISNDPSLSSPNSGPNVQILLETAKLDAKRAKAQIGFQKGDTIFNIKLEGPLGSNTDQTTWADLNGLANSVVADIGFCDFVWKPSPNKGLAKAIDQYHSDFIKQYKKEGAEKEWENIVNEKNGFNSDNLPKQYKDKYLKGSYGTPLQWGIRIQIGREKYSYLNSTKFEENTSLRTNFALIWFNGIVFPESNLFLGVSCRYQSVYKAGDPKKICIPIGDVPGALSCFELPIGEPARNNSGIGQFEARYFISAQFACNPKITYDFNAKVFGLEFPCYFLKDTKDGLNGGVSVGWRSDKKDLGIRFFVGNSFKIFRD